MSSGVPFALLAAHHRTAPTGWVLAVVVLIALLYIALRTGRLGKLRNAVIARRSRGEGRRAEERDGEQPAVRVRPLALLPMALLVIVIVVLLISHG